MRTLGRLAAPTLVVAAVLALAVSSALAGGGLRLGSKLFAAPVGAGFGHVEPQEIFNGGDPSGLITKIRWRDWGEPTAFGVGLNPIFKPGGGYYRKPARIELRATRIGPCGSHRAYRVLEAREPKVPGGKPGRWFRWSGARNICEPGF